MSNVKCQLLHVECQMSYVKFYMSNVRCQMSLSETILDPVCKHSGTASHMHEIEKYNLENI